MERSLFAFVWRHSRAAQIIIILLSALTIPIVYLSLEIPKNIIDDAIQGSDFPRTVFGLQFSQTSYLFVLCGIFLLLVISINVIKYYLNIKKGLTGERMLRRLRYSIYRRSLLANDENGRRRPPAEVTQMITAEVEPVGGFMGDVIATPVFQGSTLLVYIVFIFVQDPFLGMAAIAMYPIQAVIIPLIQKRVIGRTQERLKSIRSLSAELSESIGARDDVLGYNNLPWHAAQVSSRLFFNFKMRFAIFRLKFIIKFINNFASQLTPFFFYAYGGYLVIVGAMPVGSLVAVLAAYKDLSGPWKELLNYYQRLSDMCARYKLIVLPFAETEDRELETPDQKLSGPIRFADVEIPDDTGNGALNAVSFPIGGTGITAIAGDDDSGRVAALQALAGRVDISGGSIEYVDGVLSPTTLRSSVAYAPAEVPIFRQTMAFNLAYSALREPAALDDAEGLQMQDEAAATGSVPGDLRGDWYGDQCPSKAELIAIAENVGLANDLYRLGLQAKIDPEAHPDLVALILKTRTRIRSAQQADETLRDRVVFWDSDAYNPHADLGSNLVFHASRHGTGELAENTKIRAVLDRDPFAAELYEIGGEICERLLSLFENVTKDKALIAQYGLFSNAEIPPIRRALKRLESSGASGLRRADRALLTRVAFGYSTALHRLGVMHKEGRIERCLDARKRFEAALVDDQDFVSFNAENYLASLTIADNLLHGKVNRERGGSWPPVEDAIDAAAGGKGLRSMIMQIGLEEKISEDDVNAAQRRRISIARAIASDRSVIVADGFENNVPERDPELRGLLDYKDRRSIVMGVSSVEKAVDLDADIIVALKDSQLVDVQSARPEFMSKILVEA